MEIIFHIGMGKTGTSSIQAALNQSATLLRSQGIVYLGMWFSEIGPEFSGLVGHAKFFKADAATMRVQADNFVEFLAAKAKSSGCERFIMSNEGLYQQPALMEVFVNRLRETMKVSLVAYLRPPQSWLQSAFVQWGIRHKRGTGPIESFATCGRELIEIYSEIHHWYRAFGDILTLRRYDFDIDVVEDISQVLGLRLETINSRFLERAEDAEVLFRALFNNRFTDPVMPDRFNAVMYNTNKGPAPSIDDMIKKCFDYADADEIIEEKKELFEFIRDKFDIDFLDGQKSKLREIDPEIIRARLFDYLTEIVINQSLRLHRLEKKVEELLLLIPN